MYELRDDMRNMLVKCIGTTPDNGADAYQKRGAVNFADEINVPLLLIHSTNDKNVPYSQAEAFAAKLEEYGKVYELITREDDIHSIKNDNDWLDIIKWLDEHRN